MVDEAKDGNHELVSKTHILKCLINQLKTRQNHSVSWGNHNHPMDSTTSHADSARFAARARHPLEAETRRSQLRSAFQRLHRMESEVISGAQALLIPLEMARRWLSRSTNQGGLINNGYDD